MFPNHYRTVRLFVLFVLSFWMGVGGAGEAFGDGNLSSELLKDRLDPLISGMMETNRIPGGAFIAVQDGRVVYSKGYGFSNLSAGTEVDPGKTLWRMASVTKWITATAIMQLAEQGRVSLHEDVRSYLGHAAPLKTDLERRQPLTLEQILTHTAGLDTHTYAYASREKSGRMSLTQFLRRARLWRVREPETVIAYSNIGFVMAGYVLERVAGMSYADYVRRNIFDPLGMTNSVVSLEPGWESRLAKSYYLSDGRQEAYATDYLNIGPAAGLVSTVEDLARFMMAHLGQGELDGKRILKIATAKEMRRRQFTHHPELPGSTFGLFEREYQGHRLLQHRGAWQGNRCLAVLFPEKQTGWFIIYNRNDSYDLAYAVTHRMVNEFFGSSASLFENAKPSPPISGSDPVSQELEGWYRHTRNSVKSVKLYGKENDLEIRRHPKGGIRLMERHYVSLGDSLFELASGEPPPDKYPLANRVAFFESEEGAVEYLLLPSRSFQKLKWYQTRPVNQALLLSCSAVFLVGAMVWPFQWLIKKCVGRDRASERRISKTSKSSLWLAWFVCILSLGFQISYAITVLRLDRYQMFYGAPEHVRVLLWIPWILVTLAAILIPLLVFAWKEKGWSIAQRTLITLITACLWIYMGLLSQDHLFQFSVFQFRS